MQWSEEPSKQIALTCPKQLQKYNIRDVRSTLRNEMFLFLQAGDRPEALLSSLQHRVELLPSDQDPRFREEA